MSLFVVTIGAAFLVPQFLPASFRRWSLLIVAGALAVVFFWVAAAAEGRITVTSIVLLSIVSLVNGLSLRVCYDCGTLAFSGKSLLFPPTTCRRCGGPLVGIAKPAPAPGPGPGT